MPRSYPAVTRRQVVELARAGTKVPQLSATFGMSEATIYNWLRQERVDRGEIAGTSTDMALDLAAARRRIRKLLITPSARDLPRRAHRQLPRAPADPTPRRKEPQPGIHGELRTQLAHSPSKRPGTRRRTRQSAEYCAARFDLLVPGTLVIGGSMLATADLALSP